MTTFYAPTSPEFGSEAVLLQPEELREAVKRKLIRTLEEYNVPD
ncbi:hypothetical protein [Paenibacillus graminis]|nr:hypothetical protein [Paenibacillus graminis]